MNNLEVASYCLVCTAGVLTRLALNRRNVAGDWAAASYACASLMLYLILRNSAVFGERALTTSIALSAAYAASALLTTATYRLSPWHPLARYPGPSLWHISSLWLTYVSYRGRRHLILDRLHAQYGDYVRIGPNVISINSPSAQYIYSSVARMPKSDSYRAPGHEGVVALFFKQPSERVHSDRKRVWSGLFTQEGMGQLTPFLERRTFQLLDCLERRQAESPTKSVNLADCIYHWSYDLMGDFVFGGCNKLEMMKNGDPDEMIWGGKLATLLLDSVGQSPWLLDIVWRLPLGRSMHRLTKMAGSLMDSRLRVSEPPSFRDLVSFLTDDGTIPDRDLRLEAIVAMQGGSDNTSITITLATYFITTEPRYFKLLRSELETAFPDPAGPLPQSQLSQLPLLDAVIHEALRLGSPYFLPRIVPEGGVTLDGHFIPEGTVVANAAYSQQVHPDNFFPDPLNFRPERWLPNGLGPSTRANKGALSSFSSGPHACIARQLAFQEMRHVLARLVLNMDIRPVEDFDAKAFRHGILNMRTTVLEVPFIVRVQRTSGAIRAEDVAY